MIALAAPSLPELMLIGFFFIFVVFPVWKICEKAGFPGWLSVAVFFPPLNLLLLYYLAFATWPALEKKSD